ncbi:MAG: hypothetical protein QM758_11300 [Armatimonas sp.]
MHLRTLLTALCLVATTVCHAEWVPRVGVTSGGLYVNEVAVAKVRKPLAGLTATERATVAGNRLREVVTGGLAPDQIKVDVQYENRSEKRTRMVPKNHQKDRDADSH